MDKTTTDKTTTDKTTTVKTSKMDKTTMDKKKENCKDTITGTGICINSFQNPKKCLKHLFLLF